MDLNTLREAVIEATARALDKRLGYVPSDDSDEWEEEYRRQFAALKQRYGGDLRPAAPRPAAPAGRATPSWPKLTGTPEQKRFAATIRAERMDQIPSEPFRVFLAKTWTRAKQWVDTREVPTAVLVQRLRPQFEEYRKQEIEGCPGARRHSAEKDRRNRRLSAASQKGRHHRGGAGRADRRQRALRPGADCRQAGRARGRGTAVASIRDERPEPAARQGKTRPASARRLRDRARRGAGRRSSSCSLRRRSNLNPADLASWTRSAARSRGFGSRRWPRSQRGRAGCCVGSGGNRLGPVPAPFRIRARRHLGGARAVVEQR